MSIQNLVSMQINPADVVEINEFILKIKGKLGTGLISLKPEERRAYAKMGDKSLAFVEKALDFGSTYPDLVPPYVDLAELKKDLEAVKVMISILHKLEEITTKLDDTALLAGSEAYTAALSIYAAAKDASRRNVGGAVNAYNEMKMRFPGRKGNYDSTQS